MTRISAAIFWAGLALLLDGTLPVVAEACTENRYSSDGTLRSVVYSDCDSGKRLARSVFWRNGALRSFDARSDTKRFRENRDPGGNLRSLRYRDRDGLALYFSAKRTRIQGAHDPQGVSTVQGLRIFSTGETLTFYDPAGVPERRVDMEGRPLSIPEAALPSTRLDPFGLSWEASIQQKVEAGAAADGVFLGDSLVSHLHGLRDPRSRLVWDSLTNDHFILNGSVAGDMVSNLLARTWAIVPTARLVAIQIGTNNHGPYFPDADPVATAEAIARLVAEAQRIAPAATIVLIPIPPRAEPASLAKNQRTNRIIASLADGDRVLFVEGGPEFDPADPEHSDDGLHQTYAGAVAWYSPLVAVFQEILARDS